MDGVAANVVIPSLADALDVGEAFLEHPLPHDRIRPAGDFKPLDAQALFIPRLKELSQERLNACKDFSYVIEDVMKAKDRLKTNRLSLNKTAREKELAESDALQKSRNAERRARFVKMSEEDKKTMSFFKLTLDDLEKGADLKPYNPADEGGEYMRRAKDETADLDETPKWPTGLDPVKRESISVLKDLVDITESARLAGLLKGTAEVR
jgi:carboxyl-terminal processing protease